MGSIDHVACCLYLFWKLLSRANDRRSLACKVNVVGLRPKSYHFIKKIWRVELHFLVEFYLFTLNFFQFCHQKMETWNLKNFSLSFTPPFMCFININVGFLAHTYIDEYGTE